MAKNMANMEGDKLISLVPTQNSLDVAVKMISKYGIDLHQKDFRIDFHFKYYR